MDKDCPTNLLENSSIEDLDQKQMEPASRKASVTISYVRKPTTSALPVTSSSPHSVSVTSIPMAKIKPPERSNVVSPSFQSDVSEASGTTSSLNNLTIAPACTAQSAEIQNVNNESIVPVVRRASHGSPSVSVEAVTFKTPPPLRPFGASKSSSDSIRPSVSVSVVRNEGRSPIVRSSTSRPDGNKPSVKIASFARAQPSSELIANVHEKLVEQNEPSALKTSLRPSFKSIDISAQNKNVTSGCSIPLRRKSVSSAAGSALSSQSAMYKVVPKLTQMPSPTMKHSTVPPNSSNNGNINENDDEEEILVYVQFDSQLDSDLLQQDTAFKIIGIDTEKPVLQLGDQVFEGNWHDTIGTAVFFEEDASNALAGDPVFTRNPEQSLKYHSKTRKSLQMSRIFIKPKEPDSLDSEDVSSADASNIEESVTEYSLATEEVT